MHLPVCARGPLLPLFALASLLTTANAGAAGADQAPPSPPNQPKPAKPDEQVEPAPPRIEEHVIVTGRDRLIGDPTVQRLEVSDVLDTAGGFENVFQVLPYLPGVAATDDEQGKLSVRGAGPEYNIVLIDGVAVQQYQRFGDFQNSFVNPATLRSITLDASGLDAGHSGGLSSTVVLETRDGRTDRSFAVSGSLGLSSGDVLVEGRVPGTRSASWWATARGTYYRLVKDRGGEEQSVTPGFGELQFKLTSYPTARTRLTIFGLTAHESMEEWFHDAPPRPGDPPISVLVQEFKAVSRLAAPV